MKPLKRLLQAIDGRSYGAYRDLKGRWPFESFSLIVDHVQADPFAPPSRIRVLLRPTIDATLYATRDAREATEDWLLRQLGARLRASGNSGLTIYQPGPEIVERSALRVLSSGEVEIRLTAQLPAHRRNILGDAAYTLFSLHLQQAVRQLTITPSLNAHVQSVCKQRALRRALQPAGLVAFVANGSVLPRASGVDPVPLKDALPFQSPPSLEVCLNTPVGAVSGMGVPEGVTVIIGGGFHGKSTLLKALQRGHLDHIPGDGREAVVSLPTGVKVRAEDGRRVEQVDISPFLRELPGGQSTQRFSTSDASGSTSMAANIIEAIELGAQLLFMDEDTSATNLLVRDVRMRQLIPREREPITPLVERVEQLYTLWGVSSILVVGGVADYLSAAHRVIAMDHFVAIDLTDAARALFPLRPTPPNALRRAPPRVPSERGLHATKVKARDERRLLYGEMEIELAAVEHLRDAQQLKTVGLAMQRLTRDYVDGHRGLATALVQLEALMHAKGVEVLSPHATPPGDLVRPRIFEVGAAINRLRTLKIKVR